jgi:hypothetical protein
MTNVIQLFAAAPQIPHETKRTVKPLVATRRERSTRTLTLKLTAEAGRLAAAVNSLATIEHEEAQILQHITFRDEKELTKNMQVAVQLLQRFAKELKLDVCKEDNRNSESA